MSQRIEKIFEKTQKENRAALIPFIMGYDPDAATTLALMEALSASGADIIEIGVPFSDPMADGPVIQAAGKRALDNGATLAGILELVHNFRKKNTTTPIILMGYFNPVYRYGNERFCKDASDAGVDGIILVDLPPEEENEIRDYLDSSGLKLIRLIAPTSKSSRLALLANSASGFVYYISVAGITGAKSANIDTLRSQLTHVRQFTKLPVAVGFGIKTAEQVKQVAAFSDAVVVGSALVEAIAKEAPENKIKAASAFIAQMAKALPR